MNAHSLSSIFIYVIDSCVSERYRNRQIFVGNLHVILYRRLLKKDTIFFLRYFWDALYVSTGICLHLIYPLSSPICCPAPCSAAFGRASQNICCQSEINCSFRSYASPCRGLSCIILNKTSVTIRQWILIYGFGERCRKAYYEDSA